MREITPDGVIHLIAGDGIEGDRGQSGLATRAELDSPQGVAVSAKGDVFIADTYNNVVREVTPRGLITATAAELAYQTQQSALPLPAFPGALRTPPVQQAGRRPSVG